jgi:hypothetical protein
MTKDELKDKVKIFVKQIYKPKILTGQNSVSLDSSKFPVLDKFPLLKKTIVDLLSDQFEIFVKEIQWIAPKPTTFRIVLANDENFTLIYSPRSWVAKIEGKKYYLLNLGEEEQATESISRLLSYGKPQEDTPPEEGPSDTPETSGNEEDSNEETEITDEE